MFTGIVEELGTVKAIAPNATGARLEIAAARVLEDAELGASIAVNGCCLTVVGLGPGWWAADAVEESLRRTCLGALRPGDRVNLERPVRLADRLGGHLVQGHVDGVARVRDVRQERDARLVDVTLPPPLAELVVPRGSIALDGVSLTVSEILDGDTVRLSLTEYTLSHTTLGDLRPGDEVHVEGDIIGKYVQRLVAAYRAAWAHSE
jgi:riboflavin synthase